MARHNLVVSLIWPNYGLLNATSSLRCAPYAWLVAASRRDVLRGLCHRHTALEEQFLNVTQAQLEANVLAHCSIDNAGWETATVMERFRLP
jgi:hypothetical protein